MKTVSVKTLERLGACPMGLRCFKRVFGKRVKITLENCYRAANSGLDMSWAAGRLLDRQAYQYYNYNVLTYKFDDAISWGAAREKTGESFFMAWESYMIRKGKL